MLVHAVELELGRQTVQGSQDARIIPSQSQARFDTLQILGRNTPTPLRD
jgi:hypothetical protein